jgi:hypothetical protein
VSPRGAGPLRRSGDCRRFDLRGVGIRAREPRFEQGLLRLVDRGHGDIDRRGGVVLGLTSPALQFGGRPAAPSSRRSERWSSPSARRPSSSCRFAPRRAWPDFARCEWLCTSCSTFALFASIFVFNPSRPLSVIVGFWRRFRGTDRCTGYVMSPVSRTMPPGLVHRTSPETVASGRDAVQPGQCDDLERRGLFHAGRSRCRYG